MQFQILPFSKNYLIGQLYDVKKKTSSYLVHLYFRDKSLEIHFFTLFALLK